MQLGPTRARLFELALDLLCVVHPSGRLLDTNRAFFTTFGWTAEELLDRPFTDYIHPDDVAASLHELNKLTQGIPSPWFESRWRCKDGTYKDIAWSCQPDAETGHLHAVGRDVTAQRAVERSLRQTFDATPTGLLLVDERGEVVMANPCVAKLLGYEVDELLGLPVEALVPRAHRSLHLARRLEADAFGIVKRMGLNRRVAAVAKNGDEVPVEVSLSTIEGLGERLVLAAVSDQRQHQAFEESLERARNVAEEASRAKSQFLANMSHEIRTPLTAILGFAELLQDSTSSAASEEQRTQTIDIIKNAGAHLLTVINDILDLSKIEAGKMTLERIEMSLVDLLREVDRLLRGPAHGKGIALRVTLATSLPDRIVSDPTRLRQILMNLVGNAVKFTETGTVTMTARAESREGELRLQIDVDDTGPGMSVDQTEALFRAFGQADGTVTRKHGGTGLGLTICRRLAGLMGGTVTLARSGLGEGSCFRVDLPLEAVPGAVMTTSLDDTQARRAEASTSNVRLAGRILLAEDGVDNQRLIAFHLKKAGAVVDIADNGAIALLRLEEAEASGSPYDLLLTDMQMPEMDGYALARTLRQRGSTLSIVALTAHAMAEDRDRCTEAGCDDYAQKPIDRKTLLATCAAWLGKPGGKGRGTLAA